MNVMRGEKEVNFLKFSASSKRSSQLLQYALAYKNYAIASVVCMYVCVGVYGWVYVCIKAYYLRAFH